ncbi:Myosin type-2 heavy chain 1 [Labeo rohita]|uniref:Myosin type-2 heavy chain 1 n=1 Tax=Labeo rohita TaxID=84645 RepID=A0ABQ8LAY7_LABRO|nr:Myosin type-2 heavy chain 1 [Labeo rohita]
MGVDQYGSGPPALYQLKTERTYIANIRRWTYGSRDTNKENKVILLVGETGAGKTTMVNTMINYLLGASQNRLSGKENYIFHSVLSLFGRDIENNIVFIITHSDGGDPVDALNAINTAQIHCRRDERKKPVHFLFNNQQKEKRGHAYKSEWKIGKKSIKKFLTLLSENNRKSLQMTADVLKQPKQLEACIFNQMDRITEKEFKLKELTEIMLAISPNKDKIDKSDSFKFRVNKTVKEKTRIINESWRSKNATYCTRCEENCHLRGYWWVSFGNLKGCDVMEQNYCTVCTGKCHYSEHKKENQKYVITTKQGEMSFNDLKQMCKCTSDQPEKIEEKLNSDLQEIKTQKSILLNEAYMTIMNRSKIPLKSDSYLTPQDLDFFIPRLVQEGEKERVNDLHYVRRSVEMQRNRLENQSLLGRAWDYVTN